MQMTFVGCIGYFMQCSGLGDVLETVCASCSVDVNWQGSVAGCARSFSYRLRLDDSAVLQILHSRSIYTHLRGKLHYQPNFWELKTFFLVFSISEMPWEKDKPLPLEEDKASDIPVVADKASDITQEKDKSSEMTQEEDQSAQDWSVIDGIKSDMNEIVKIISQTGKGTALLWLQYMEIVRILRNFITTEYTGDWSLHLSTVKQILPYYAVAGHNQYAKSAYIYCQQM